MLKITCFKCQNSWSLNRDAIQQAYDSIQPGEDYYAVECPKCRRINKVGKKQLERMLPHSRAEDKKA